MSTNKSTMLPVTRTKSQAKASYDRLSRFYDLFGAFEQRYKNLALERLEIIRGETVLEVGFGTGQCLMQIAESVGEGGKVCGLDISSGMLAVARRRLEKAGLLHRVELVCQDALTLSYNEGQFDAVFMSFTLELLDSPEIPQLLAQVRRILKPGGRLGVISMSKENKSSLPLKVYEWLHLRLPQVIDCRPIYLSNLLMDSGFKIKCKECHSIMGLPVEIVVAVWQPPITLHNC